MLIFDFQALNLFCFTFFKSEERQQDDPPGESFACAMNAKSGYMRKNPDQASILRKKSNTYFDNSGFSGIGKFCQYFLWKKPIFKPCIFQPFKKSLKSLWSG